LLAHGTLQLSLIAAQCIRTVISAALSGNEQLRGCVPTFLPSMVEYTGQLASTADVSQPHQLAAATEIVKTFAVILSGAPGTSRECTCRDFCFSKPYEALGS
jgi:hypothetical protein